MVRGLGEVAVALRAVVRVRRDAAHLGEREQRDDQAEEAEHRRDERLAHGHGSEEDNTRSAALPSFGRAELSRWHAVAFA